MEKKFDRKMLLDCAKYVSDYLRLQDPAYDERFQITMDEYHLDELQVCLMYMARVLDVGEHMVYSEREFMQPDYVGHLGPRACLGCGVEFSPGVAADMTCGKPDCFEKQAALLDEQFEKKAKK